MSVSFEAFIKNFDLLTEEAKISILEKTKTWDNNKKESFMILLSEKRKEYIQEKNDIINFSLSLIEVSTKFFLNAKKISIEKEEQEKAENILNNLNNE